jgi:acyl carrier protein
MAFSKTWKENWTLKSLSLAELQHIITLVVTKQLELTPEEITMTSDLVADFDADSVDIVAMLLYLEEMFKNASQTTRTVVPTDKLGQVVLVEDILDIMYNVLLTIETEMVPFTPILPDLDVLQKRQKTGNMY